MRKRINIYFNEQLYERVSDRCKESGTSKSELIRRAVEEFLGKYVEEPEKDQALPQETLNEIERLRNEMVVLTPSLAVAEALVNEFSFDCVRIESRQPETGKPKIWVLHHPDYVEEPPEEEASGIKVDLTEDEFLEEIPDELARHFQA